MVTKTEKIKLKRGDCYAFPSAHFYRGMVVSFPGTKYCSFLLSGHTFAEVPNIEEFKNSGLWGMKTGSSFDFSLRFQEITFFKKTILDQIEHFRFIGNIYIPYPIYTNGGGANDNLTSIDSLISYFSMANEKIRDDKFYNPYEIFTYADLDLALFSEEHRELLKDKWRLNKKTASTFSKELMLENWMWSETDDFAPFGSDEGSDTLYSFKRWRDKNPQIDPAEYLNKHKSENEIPESIDPNVAEILKSMNLDQMLINGYHRSIISVAFGQLVLEGIISPDLKKIALQTVDIYKKNMLQNAVPEKHQEEFIYKIDSLKDILKRV